MFPFHFQSFILLRLLIGWLIKKTELTKGFFPSAARPSLAFKTRRFPSPDYSGFGFIGYLST
jgi:hypothetical protein